jgi:hypothetical protein
VAALGAVILAFPSAGSALVAQLVVELTPNGPSPSVLNQGVAGRSPLWINQDQVTHTVAFANGLCSLQLAPGEHGECSNTFYSNAGQYPYTVDGTVQATLIVRLWARTVTLTGSGHAIKRGAQLILQGELAAEVPLPGPSLQPVVILARHDRSHAFRRVAVVRPKAEGTQAIWRLRVRPRTRTTYIAEANYEPGSGVLWQDATSKPFKVVVRARR